MPTLLDALAGPGAPAGVLGAQKYERSLIVEFDPVRSSWTVLQALIDAELGRFGPAVRTTKLLAPLAPDIAAKIAADGLQCPDIQPTRVLETLVQHVDR